MKKFVIPAILIYLFLDNYALTFETINPSVNEILNLPIQIPLKDLIFNTSNTPNNLIKIYIDRINNIQVQNNLIR